MKTYLKHFLVILFFTCLIGYFLSIKESFEALKLEGSYFKNIGRTLEYFFLGILWYVWWFYFIVLSLILAAISTFIFKRRKSK
jgi:hypothetical protein